MRKRWTAFLMLLLILLAGCVQTQPTPDETAELIAQPAPQDLVTELVQPNPIADTPEPTAQRRTPKKLRLQPEDTTSEKIEKPSTAPDPDRPMLALTFDDGPSAYTDRLLDYFAEYGGKGTFFVIGQQIDSRPDTIKRIVEDGHEIGGHSWNHKQLTKLDEYGVLEQLRQTRAKIYEYTGVDAKLMRPPYGSVNDQVKATAAELGVALINWNIDTLDWQSLNADIVYDTILRQARNGAIILCHDLHKTTVDAMERVIPALIEQGYQLVTVTELLTSLGGEIVPGTVYNNR